MKHKHSILKITWILFIAMASGIGIAQTQTKKAKETVRFTLPPLPYSPSALAPVISETTLKLHHGKHLQGYINNLNTLIIGTPFENKDLETIVKSANGAIFNNAAQTLNHIIYFNSFTPNGSKLPNGAFLKAIEQKWGSFDAFKKAFSSAAVSLFGAGWVWLAKDKDGNLIILQESNAGNPLSKGYTPILGFDVWEHAYYLDYQNRRPEHIEKLWTIIDWDAVSSRYD